GADDSGRNRKSKNEDSQERGEAGGFWSSGHERRDRSRGAFVNIGCPDVKWRGRDLESEADQHHGGASQQQRWIQRVVESGGDRGDVGGSRRVWSRCSRAVDQRDAVKQKRRRERSENEILQRRFI